MQRRPLLIGEAPSGLEPGTTFSPRSSSGLRLDRLIAGRPFDAVNLLARTLEPDEDWPASLARDRARILYEDALAGREVVLLGRRVARAFAGLSPWTDALQGAAYFSLAWPTVPGPRRTWARCMMWLAPHPSGRSRWWNRPANGRQAEMFFRHVLGRLEFPGEPALPAIIPPQDWSCLAESG